jgi:predicted RNA-binding Zn ribbon-like protein
MRVVTHEFLPRDLVGGHVVVDLVNTVTARNADPIDWLDGFARLLEWAELSGQFDRRALRALRRFGDAHPQAASQALDRTRALREALHAVLSAIAGNRAAPASALRHLEGRWKEAVAHARARQSGRRIRIALDVEASGLDYLNHELALRSLDLLEDLPADRIRVCGGSACGWVFIDRSKAGRRRWCDMATCGNAEKSRRHYRRTRGGASSLTRMRRGQEPARALAFEGTTPRRRA